MFGLDLGIDLGTATILVYVKGKGIVLNEPTVVAVDRETGRVLKVGGEALEMLGRTPAGVEVIRPLKDGVISDYQTTEKMLKYFIKKVSGFRLARPRGVLCVPSCVTEVENRAVKDACERAGAKRVEIIEEPVAAAIGAGIDISQPIGRMVIDIGGGTADIAVISFSGVVVSTSVKMGGDRFDEAIVRYVRKRHSMLIGERTAELIKKQIGCVKPRPKELMVKVKGRCMVTGLPKQITLSSEEVREAVQECAAAIADAARRVLEDTPPELASDIFLNGVVMTGGGSLIYGIDRYLSEVLSVPVTVAERAEECVGVGTGESLQFIS